MPNNCITDDEILYRRVPDNKGLLKVQDDGTIKISSQAFYESSYRPSVDRAKLRENDPRRSLGPYAGGVVSVMAHEVRAIDSLVQYDKNQQPMQVFAVNVEPKPIFDDPNEPDNPAHAEIYIEPECSRRVFQRLCERLALLANNRAWEIAPTKFQQ